jgi:hypothetical protein
MTGMFDFIVEPFEGRYNNSKSIDGNTLILNTELQNHMYVSRIGKVIAEPAVNNTCVKKNDLVVLHHNVFRRFRDIRGDEKNSKSYIKENMYLAGQDQLFAYKRANGWQALDGFCFVKPIKETKMFSINFEKPLTGILYYKDSNIDYVNTGDLVGFTPGSEYEFVINNDRLYRVPTKCITIKYEYQGNEEEYNPSWAQGC